MKRLQLLGRNTYFSLTGSGRDLATDNDGYSNNNNNNNNNNSSKNDYSSRCSSPQPSLLDFSDTVLLRILQQLDTRTLVNLCQTNSRLYSLISNNLLFNNVVLHSKLALLKFNAIIHSEFTTSNILNNNKNSSDTNIQSRNARFLIKYVEFANPQCQDSLLKYSKFYNKQDSTTIIAGSYNLDSISSSNVKNSSSNNEADPSSLHNANEQIFYRHTKYKNRTAIDTMERLAKLEAQYSHYTYIELMLDIIDHLPNLQHIKLSNIESNFKIPLWYSVFNDGSKDFIKKIIKGQQSMTNHDLRSFDISKDFFNQYENKFYSLQRIKKLELSAASSDSKRGQQQYVPLRSNLLCCFGIINELILQNFIIDRYSLETPMEFIPLYLRRDNKSDYYSVSSTYSHLSLISCNIIPGNGILKLFQEYFKDVKSLKLINLQSKYDLLLCNCFPSLNDLTIDCNSACFTNQQFVSDNYYYKENPNNHHNNDDNDSSSLTETLLDDPNETTLQSPPPTTSVVLSLNLNYISRTMTDVNNSNILIRPSLLTKGQSEFFQHFRIPPFHYFFHYYKSLWDRLPHKNINISIVNIPFTNVYPLSAQSFVEIIMKQAYGDTNDQETLIAYRNSFNRHNDQQRQQQHHGETDLLEYPWNDSIRNCLRDSLWKLKERPAYSDIAVDDIIEAINPDTFNNYQNFKNFRDIPNVNLHYFLHSLSRFKSVNIQMLRKFVDCTERSRYDWELLLKPVLNVNVPIEVTDRDGIVLYSYGKKRS